MSKPKSIDDLYDAWVPGNEERSIMNLRGYMGGAFAKWRPKGQHYSECWNFHGECGLNELKKLERRNK